jgi:hypothetical protein
VATSIVPINATTHHPLEFLDEYYRQETIIVEPESIYQFNFTWFDIDYAKSLTFTYITNDTNSPLYVFVENSTYVYYYDHEWFDVVYWSESENTLPTTEELWWFTFHNRHTLKAVNVTYTLTYDNDLLGSVRFEDAVLLVLLFSALVGIVIVYYVRDYRKHGGIQDDGVEYPYEAVEPPEHIKQLMEKKEDE